MKKALGFLFAFLAVCEAIAIYPTVRILLDSTSGDGRTKMDTPNILLALSVAAPLCVGFTIASIWCFRTFGQTKGTKGNGG
jgi:hypothetical protein